MLLVTNNERVRARFEGEVTLQFVSGSHGDVLLAARGLIHGGHALLTHPLAGSVKPNETPFRSVALSGRIEALDPNSLALIEDALAVCRTFPPRFLRGEDAPPAMREDFAEIDLQLMEGAIVPHLLGRSVI